MIVLKSLVAALALLMVVRLFPPMRFLFMMGLLLAAVGTFVYLLIRSLRDGHQRRRRLHSVEGQIERRMKYCNEQIQRQEQEVAAIRKSMEQLRESLGQTTHPLPEIRRETERVLADFQREHDLRQAKMQFFRECHDKLDNLLHQHLLHRELEQKKRQLDRLRQPQYDELTDLEQLRWDVENEETYLQNIIDLSQRAATADTVDHTAQLREELEQMRTMV